MPPSENSPTFHVIQDGALNFEGASTAGTANITAGFPVDPEGGFDAGFVKFLNNSTADHATITTEDASNTEFHDSSTAGFATLTAAHGGFIFFDDTATADHATINVNSGGEMDFSPIFPGCGCTGGATTADHAQITNSGTIGFYQGSSAGQRHDHHQRGRGH